MPGYIIIQSSKCVSVFASICSFTQLNSALRRTQRSSAILFYAKFAFEIKDEFLIFVQTHWKKNQINTSLELELATLNVWQQTQNSKQQLAAIPLLAAKFKILASLVNKNGIKPLQWSLNKLWFSLILCIWHFGLKHCTANVYCKLLAVVLKTVWVERLGCVIWKIMKSKYRQYRWKRC